MTHHHAVDDPSEKISRRNGGTSGGMQCLRRENITGLFTFGDAKLPLLSTVIDALLLMPSAPANIIGWVPPTLKIRN